MDGGHTIERALAAENKMPALSAEWSIEHICCSIIVWKNGTERRTRRTRYKLQSKHSLIHHLQQRQRVG